MANLRVGKVKLAVEPEVSFRESFLIQRFGEFFGEGLSIGCAVFPRVLVFDDVEPNQPVPSGEEDVDRLRRGVFEFAVQLCNLCGKGVESHQAARV